MKKIKKYCVDEEQTIKDAISVIQNNLSRCVVVLNSKKKVVGVFSEGDVLRAILNDIDVHAPLKKVIKPSFFYLKEKNIEEAYKFVKKHGITLIPLVDTDFKLKDVFTIFDIMKHMSYAKGK